ncbi:MAG: aromatic aminobenezylarsenical efflux permease ArsG family transporter [Victivallales bacterium]|jgi:cytochrome c biogenesis protein CcdA
MNWLAITSALWLGMLTAISPCPLAANIAAISFVSRHVGNHRRVLMSGLLYTAGRAIAYVALSAAITAGLMATGEVSRFLQKYLNEILGPLLILVGMILLGMIGSGMSFNIFTGKIQEKAERGGIHFAFPLGIIFALSFCPVSAGLFFGALIPLSVRNSSQVLLPLVYGAGTALPVIVFAFLIAFGGEMLGKAFDRLTHIELWVRRITGIIFILAGIYYCLTHIYEVNFRG